MHTDRAYVRKGICVTVDYVLMLVGFILLIGGAKFFVDGASAIARRLRVSDLVIGLTVVSFGTGAPEFVVSVMASATGKTEISVGNILGSNIINVQLILGLSAIICPIVVTRATVWKEIPLSLLAAVMVGVLGSDALLDGAGPSALTRTDGFVLLSFFVVFLYYVLGLAKDRRPEEDPSGAKRPGLRGSITIFILGLGALNLGAKWVVQGAVAVALAMGVSEWTVGLTIVAVGTSLPELVASGMAAWKKNTDLAVGNIVGSNIFNIFFVLGVSATIRPLPVPSAYHIDVVVTILSSLLLMGWMLAGRRRYVLRRWHGVAGVLLYVAYVTYRLV